MDIKEIIKILKENLSDGGGPLPTKNGEFNLENLALCLDPLKSDTIIHIQYFPEGDRYGFAVYRLKK